MMLPITSLALSFVERYNRFHYYVAMCGLAVVAIFAVLLALYILYALFCEGMKFRRQYKETMTELKRQLAERDIRLRNAQEEHDALYHQDKQTEDEEAEDSASS